MEHSRLLARDIKKAARIRIQYLASLRRSRELAPQFEDVQSFVIFIGYPHSGHSAVGSLIDAHPDAVIAHEMHVMEYLRFANFKRLQLYSLLLDRSRQFAEAGRQGVDYSYIVPHQWQGRFRDLRVIGDKKGGATTYALRSRPELLEKLRERVEPLRVVHVVRNPFDNITTIARRRRLALEQAIEYYFDLCETNVAITKALGEEAVHVIRHEDLLSDPRRELSRLLEFLELEPDPDYLTDCAGMLYPTPHRSRSSGAWAPNLIEAVETRTADYPMLHGYAYAEQEKAAAG